MADAPVPPPAPSSDTDLPASSSVVGEERITSTVSGGVEEGREALDDTSVEAMAVDGIAEPAEEAAAREDDNAARSTVEKILPVIMVHIMEYVDIPQRIKFASLSTTLRQLVYEECSPLWEDIDFSKVHWKKRENLSDEMLSALLTRVNARQVTKTLNLRNCLKLRGTGLEPLRHSRFLERAYLPFGIDATHINSYYCTNLLRTMLPHKLFIVRLHESPHLTTFLRELHVAMFQRARGQKVKCSCCHNVVADESSQIVPDLHGVPSTRCSFCYEHFCRKASCSVVVRDCSSCSLASCATCDRVQRCSECALSYCGHCRYVSTDCYVCKQAFCEECTSVRVCSICSKTLCVECEEEQAGDIPIYRCEGYCCDDWFCNDCQEGTSPCDCCGAVFCFQCREMTGYCDSCEKDFCSECREVFSCEWCKASFCASLFCGADHSGKCSMISSTRKRRIIDAAQDN